MASDKWKRITDSDQCDCAGLWGGSSLFCHRGGTLPSHIPYKSQVSFTSSCRHVCFSIFNFSCNPNAVWSWTKGDFRRKVVIIQDLEIWTMGEISMRRCEQFVDLILNTMCGDLDILNRSRCELSSPSRRGKKYWWTILTWRISTMAKENQGIFNCTTPILLRWPMLECLYYEIDQAWWNWTWFCDGFNSFEGGLL